MDTDFIQACERLADLYNERFIQVNKAAESHAAPKIMSIFCRSIPSPPSARKPQKQQRARRDHRAIGEAEGACPPECQVDE